MSSENTFVSIMTDSVKMACTGVVLIVYSVILGLFMFSALAIDILFSGLSSQYMLLFAVLVMGLALGGSLGFATRLLLNFIVSKILQLRRKINNKKLSLAYRNRQGLSGGI